MRALALALVVSVALVLAWLADYHQLDSADGWSGTAVGVAVGAVLLWPRGEEA